MNNFTLPPFQFSCNRGHKVYFFNLTHTCFFPTFASVLAFPLTLPFNLLIDNGIFPIDLGSSCRVSIHLNGKIDHLENFHPINIICDLLQAFEIAVYEQIIKHVRTTEKQHGFNWSTVPNWFCITFANTF